VDIFECFTPHLLDYIEKAKHAITFSGAIIRF